MDTQELTSEFMITGTFPVSYDMGEFLDMLGRGGGWQGYCRFKPFKAKWFKVGTARPLPDWDMVYVNVHPLKDMPFGTERGTEEDIAFVGHVYGDADMNKGWTQEKIDALPLRPSAVVFSGGGWQPYFFIDEPVKIDSEETRQRMKRLQEAFVAKFGFDNGAKDLARVLRVPYSLNNKYEEPRQVYIQSWDKECFYALEELEAAVGIHSNQKISQHTSFVVPEKIYEGQPVNGFAGRDDFLFKYGCRLLALGKSEDEMKEVVRAYNRDHCKPSLDDSIVDKKIEQALSYHAKDNPDDDLDSDEGLLDIRPASDVFLPRPPMEFIVDGLIDEHSVTVLAGAPGSMKTFSMLSMCAHIAKGQDFLGRKTKQCKVLWLDVEMGWYRLLNHAEKALRGTGFSFKDMDKDMFLASEIGNINLWKNPESDRKKLRHEINRLGVKFVVIDAFTGIMTGGKENDVDVVSAVFTHLRWVAEETGCSILIIHHMQKNGEDYRGSSEILAKPDNVFYAALEDDGRNFSIKSKKARSMAEVSFLAKVEHADDSFALKGFGKDDVVSQLTPHEREIYNLLKGMTEHQLSSKQIRGMVEVQSASTAVSKTIPSLIKKGVVKNVAPEGKAAIYELVNLNSGIRSVKKLESASEDDL